MPKTRNFKLDPVLAGRLTAAVVALAIFFMTRKTVGLGVAAGAGALVLLTWTFSA